MRASGLACAAAAFAIGVLASGCGAEPRPLRVGVIVDCQGAYRALEDVALSGAELPLIRRGARLRGNGASSGLRDARVGGRSVQLVTGCSETGEFSTLTAVARRLVEREHVDAIVAGGLFSVDGLVLREVARRYPDVPFIAAANGPREVTLRRPAANLFRIAADYGQASAGLATYAYRTLGWRRAGLVVESWVAGWGAEAAFVREFCSLGGRVAFRHLLFTPGGGAREAARVPRHADGIAVLGSGLYVTPTLLADLARRGDAPSRLLLGPDVIADRELLAQVGRALTGVVSSAYLPPKAPAVRAQQRAYRRAFPGASTARATDPLVVGYSVAIEALVRALTPTAGSSEATSLKSRLATLRGNVLGVPVRMAGSGQAVVDTTLVRIGRAAPSQPPPLEPVGSVGPVDQSVGGLLAPSEQPGELGQRCRAGRPPPWAR